MARLEDRIDWDRLYPSFDPHFQRFASRRSVVFGTKGVVASSQPFATEAGLSILRQGGNAADAAVAVAAALNVTEPTNCGIGGDAFCLFWNDKEKSLKGVNGSGRSPAKLTLQKARELGIKGKEIPLKNINSVTVPGACASWEDTVSLFGSGKVTLSDCLQPAIRLAEDGFPVSELVALQWQGAEKLLLNASENGKELLVPETGKAPHAGEIMRNPMLARTLKEVAEKGKDGFYKGRIAEEIVKLIQSKGGVMELSDLASHTSTPVTPISYNYHASNSSGIKLHEIPPNGQGLTALMALGILEHLEDSGVVPDLSTVPHNGTQWLHTLIECLRIAFADTRAFVADPEKTKVPTEELLAPSYLQSRAKLFHPKKANAEIKKGAPWKSSDTVYFSVADKEGNACSFIFSNYAGVGTGAVPKGCGFSLQNRGSNFVLEEGHPNCLEPNKRPYHTIIPAMVTRGDELLMSFGVMGGFMQPQGHLQVLMNMLHRGFHVQNALDAPRFCISAGMPDATDDQGDAGDINSEVFLEEGIDPKVADELRAMGHDVKLMSGYSRSMFGRGQVIQRLVDPVTKRRVWAAGSDPRADGHAAAEL